MRYLVICNVGEQSLHRSWCTNDRNFDVLLIAYEEKAYDDYKNDGNGCFYQPGSKFTAIKQLVENDKIKYENYDYIVSLDDDVVTTAKDLNKFFETCGKYNLSIAHPAVNPVNCKYDILYKNEGLVLHYTSWTELLCVGFSRQVFGFLFKFFDENTTGWGFPELWHWILKERGFDPQKIFACIDVIEIIHTRACGAGANTLYNLINKEDIGKQYLGLLAKYNLMRPELLIYDYEIRNTVSFVIIYCDKDKHLVERCVRSLPKDSEVVIVKTIPTENMPEGNQTLCNVQRLNELCKYGEYFYPANNFHFAKARNAAKSLVSPEREWIFSLDVDELLNPLLHKEILMEMMNRPPDVWGLKVANVSYIAMPNCLEDIRNLTPQVRIFRNNIKVRNSVGQNYETVHELNWYGACHETIDKAIEELGGKLANTSIIIEHTGYDSSREAMINKFERNMNLLFNNPDELVHPFYQAMLENEIRKKILFENN